MPNIFELYYDGFQQLNDGEKMAAIEKYLEMAITTDEPAEWVLLFVQILRADESPCVKHEAAFNIGQLFSKYDFNEDLERIKDYVAHEFCKVIENDESLVVKHETIESIGDAGFDTLEVQKLLDKYSRHENYDIANTAQISYWQIIGKEFGS